MHEIRLVGGPLDGLVLNSTIPCGRFDLESGDLYTGIGTYDGGTSDKGRIVLHHAGRSAPVAAAKEYAREVFQTEQLGAKISKQFCEYSKSVFIIAGISFVSALLPWLWCVVGLVVVLVLILSGILVSKSMDRQYRDRTRFVQEEASGTPELKQAVYGTPATPNVEELNPKSEI